jgi:hypothetical protein
MLRPPPLSWFDAGSNGFFRRDRPHSDLLHNGAIEMLFLPWS